MIQFLHKIKYFIKLTSKKYFKNKSTSLCVKFPLIIFFEIRNGSQGLELEILRQLKTEKKYSWNSCNLFSACSLIISIELLKSNRGHEGKSNSMGKWVSKFLELISRRTFQNILTKSILAKEKKQRRTGSYHSS